MDELSAHVLNGDPHWMASEVMMWQESLPESADGQAVDLAERAVEKLDARSREASWQADSLKLARDGTVAAKLLQHVDRDQRAARLSKITHLREQNMFGANIVADFCERSCKFVTPLAADLDMQLVEARSFSCFA